MLNNNNEKIEELKALVAHMKHHTEHHTDDIAELAKVSDELGYSEASAALNECKEISYQLIRTLEKVHEAIK